MKKKSRLEFDSATRDKIIKGAGGLCSKPNCLVVVSDNGANAGEACHIYSAAEDGPRGRGDLTEEQIKSVSNGIWLCGKHHSIADRKVDPEPAQVLLEWKRVRELSNKLSCRNDDIGKSQTFISVRVVDGLIWAQLNENRDTPGFDLEQHLDEARLTNECFIFEEVIKSAIRDTGLPSGPLTAHHKPMRLTAIAKALKVPTGRPAMSPVANRRPQTLPPEVAPMLELSGKWVQQICGPNMDGAPYILVHHNLAFGLGALPMMDEDPAPLITENAHMLSRISQAPFDTGILVRLSYYSSFANWVFTIERKNGGWNVESRLEPKFGLPRLPKMALPALHTAAMDWDRLLERLADGAELVGYFSEDAHSTAHPFYPIALHTTPFRISLAHLPREWLVSARWWVRRLLLVFEIARALYDDCGASLFWWFTPEWFDKRVSNHALRAATSQLKEVLVRGEFTGDVDVDLLDVDGDLLVLRYSRGNVKVTREAAGSPNRRRGRIRGKTQLV